MAENLTSQQVAGLNSTAGFSIACDESYNVDDIVQVVLICRYVNSQGPQEELLEILPLTDILPRTGQTHGEDIESAITNCLKSKVLNINTISIETDGYQSMKCANKNFLSLLKKQILRVFLSLNTPPRGTLFTNLSKGDDSSDGFGCTNN